MAAMSDCGAAQPEPTNTRIPLRNGLRAVCAETHRELRLSRLAGAVDLLILFT